MAWRSFTKRSLVLAVLGGSLFGCGRHAVRATEKQFLTDRVMSFDTDDQETEVEERVLTSREGSTGGKGTKGGGCGCD